MTGEKGNAFEEKEKVEKLRERVELGKAAFFTSTVLLFVVGILIILTHREIGSTNLYALGITILVVGAFMVLLYRSIFGRIP